MKLTAHKYAHCDIIEDEKWIKLYSYNTLIIMYHKKYEYLQVFGLYSMTTRKHISWFISEYFKGILTFENIRYAYEKDCHIDMKNKLFISNSTGEVVKCGF